MPRCCWWPCRNFLCWPQARGRFSDHPLYTALAKELQLPLLEGAWAEVLSNPALRSDQVHGNAAGYALFTQQLFDFVRQQGWHG